MFLARAMSLLHHERKDLIRAKNDQIGTRTDHIEFMIKGISRAMEILRQAQKEERTLPRKPERLAPKYFQAIKAAHHLLLAGQRVDAIKRLEKEIRHG